MFLLTRDPRALADWYRHHLGWELQHLPGEDTYYIELYYREPDRPERPQNLVYAIMPGDPGEPGQGHIVNYRVDDIDAIVASLQRAEVETSAVTVGPDAEGQGKVVRLQDPEGHRIELWKAPRGSLTSATDGLAASSAASPLPGGRPLAELVPG